MKLTCFFTLYLADQFCFGYNRENSYLTTLPEVFPCINSSTSSTVT